jgi:hypothetical protein
MHISEGYQRFEGLGVRDWVEKLAPAILAISNVMYSDDAKKMNMFNLSPGCSRPLGLWVSSYFPSFDAK